MLETLLINILFLIFPILIFVIFFDNLLHFYNQTFLVLFSTISMILCMIYPIKLEIGFIFDLRYIPFIIVALYGGYKKVIPLFIVLNMYRFFLGGDGIWQSFLFSTVILSVIPFFHRRFLKADTKKRLYMAVSAALFTMILYLTTLSTFFEELTREYWTLATYSLITHVMIISLNVLMIEKVIFTRNDYMS